MDAGEFGEKYLTLGESLYRVAWYILESEDDAEDAVQDLYVKLWNMRDTLDSVHNPKAYSITLLRNICIDRVRGSARTVREELRDNVPGEDSADSALTSKERFMKIMSAVEKLPEGEREVLKMRVLEDLSYEEMAKLTGRSPLTLRVMLSNARRKIRKSAI